MKRLLLIIMITWLPILVFGQKQEATLIKGVTKMIIKNDKSALENYTNAAKILLDQGYAISKSDKEFFQLTTEGIRIDGEGFIRILIIYVVAKDGQITIVPKQKKSQSAQLINTPKDYDNLIIEPYRKSLHLNRIYDKIALIGKSIGGEITYSE